MATKGTMAGSKRKTAPGGKGKADGKVKKAKLQQTLTQRKKPSAKPEKNSDNSSDLSDSEDGGVKIDVHKAKGQKHQGDTGNADKTVEKSRSQDTS